MYNKTINMEIGMKNIINSKCAPLAITVVSILSAFTIFEYFDKADKCMELGYNSSVKSSKYGEIRFIKGYGEDKPENFDS